MAGKWEQPGSADVEAAARRREVIRAMVAANLVGLVIGGGIVAALVSAEVWPAGSSPQGDGWGAGHCREKAQAALEAFDEAPSQANYLRVDVWLRALNTTACRGGS